MTFFFEDHYRPTHAGEKYLILNEFFSSHEMLWGTEGICTDGAKAIMGKEM